MAEVSEVVAGSNSDTETEVEQETPKIKQWVTAITENKKTLRQPKDEECEKVKKILSKVKLALQLSVEKDKKRKKSTILVCYYRQSKKKNENQPKKDEESLTPTQAMLSAYQGSKTLK